MSELARGVGDLRRGLRALRAHRRLWRWLVAPSAVTVVVLGLVIAAVMRLFHHVLEWIDAHAPDWIASVVDPVLSVVLLVALAIAALVVFVAIMGIVAGPFHERLSEQLEAVLTGRAPPPFSARRFAGDFARGIAHGLRRLAVAVVGLAAIFALGFIPVVGTAAALIASAALASRATAYDCYDAVLARRSLSYRDKLGYLHAHRGRTLGLGAAVAAMLLVPGLNLIALGLGVAGATIAGLDEAAGVTS